MFVVTLDFGGSVFGGEARWLEIGVRTNDSMTGFIGLSPRQPITAAPYALYAPEAGLAVTAESVTPESIGPQALAVGAGDYYGFAYTNSIEADFTTIRQSVAAKQTPSNRTHIIP